MKTLLKITANFLLTKSNFHLSELGHQMGQFIKGM